MPEWIVAPISENYDEYISVAGEALQYTDTEVWQTYIRRVGAENLRGVWDNRGRFAGGLAFYRMGQWFGGRNVPTAGISGVAIEPASRGNGACKTLLIELLKELHQDGTPMAALYASTQQLYRSVGFEQAGHNFTYSLPMRSLSSLESSRQLSIERFTKPDFQMLQAATELRAKRTNGNLQRTAGLWERIFEPIGHTTSTYVFGPSESPAGFASLIHGSRTAGHPQPLVASDWVANTPDGLQRLVSLVLDHRSMCDCFHWHGGPHDPLLLAASEQNVGIVGHLRSLNRVVNFPAALAGRGYPSDVSGELHFQITDEILGENESNWLVCIREGKAEIEKGGLGSIRLDIRYAAPLYCSFASCSSLVDMGYIACDNARQIRFADVALAGPAPWTGEVY